MSTNRPRVEHVSSAFEQLLQHPSDQPLVHVQHTTTKTGNPWLYGHRQMAREAEQQRLEKLVDDKLAAGGGGGGGTLANDVNKLTKGLEALKKKLEEALEEIESHREELDELSGVPPLNLFDEESGV